MTPKRNSIAFFANFNLGQIISVLPGVGEALYEPIESEKYLVSFISSSFIYLSFDFDHLQSSGFKTGSDLYMNVFCLYYWVLCCVVIVFRTFCRIDFLNTNEFFFFSGQ